jgi:hypothetical protein
MQGWSCCDGGWRRKAGRRRKLAEKNREREKAGLAAERKKFLEISSRFCIQRMHTVLFIKLFTKPYKNNTKDQSRSNLTIPTMG